MPLLRVLAVTLALALAAAGAVFAPAFNLADAWPE
jgi:hypothetical protein